MSSCAPGLVEQHDPEPVGPADFAGVGLQLARQQLDERGLPAAVGPEQADLRCLGREDQVQAAEQRPAAERFAQPLHLDHFLRPAVGGVEIDGRSPAGAGGVALLGFGQLAHQPARLLDPPLGLGRPRLGPAVEPFDFPPDPAGQRRLAARLGGQEFLALHQEVAVAAVDAQVPVGVRPAQFHHAVAGVLQEVAVVADEQEGERRVRQQPFQPQDAFDVEVVGRLVEQEDVGLADELPGDRQPLAPPAGERAGLLPEVGEPDAAEHVAGLRLLLVLVRVRVGQRRGDDLQHGRFRREGVFLRQVAGGHLPPHRDRAGVGLFQPGEDLEQRGLARPVGPDEAGFLGVAEADRDVLEEQPRAEGFGKGIGGEQ